MKPHPSLTQLCAAWAVPRSGSHAWEKAAASQRERPDARLPPKMRTVQQQPNGRSGAPRLQDELARQGERHGCKRMVRWMRAAGIKGLCSRRLAPCPTPSAHAQPSAPNRLAERPAPTGPHQTRGTDLTGVRTAAGWLAVAVRLAWWRRRVGGWATAPTLHALRASQAWARAVPHRRPPQGRRHHRDRGVQSASGESRALRATAGWAASLSRTGHPYANAVMASCNATDKREWAGLAAAGGGYATRAEAAHDFWDCVAKYYNRARRHSALGAQTPVDFEHQLN